MKIYFIYFCSSTNPIFWKNLVPEIWAFSANQIVGFLNQLFLQNKLLKPPHFLHVGTNSQKLKVDQKFVGWAWSKNGCGQSGFWTLN